MPGLGKRIGNAVGAGWPALVLLAGCGTGGQEPGNWPSRPITISCFAAPGGGTDLVNRLVAKEMGEILGVRMNVVNRAGGRGAAAVAYVDQAPRDGYDWGGFSESLLPGSVLGVTDTTAADWHFFMVAGAPGVISVVPDSRHDSLDSLVATLRDAPRSLKAGASLTGGIWHTKLLALEGAAGIQFQLIPFSGSQPSQLAALSGEVDVVLTSISEQADLIRAGKLRPLAMIESEPFEFDGTVIPAASEPYPDIARLPVSQFLGFALPAETPDEILTTVAAAFDEFMGRPAVAEYAATRQLELLGYHGEEAARRARAAESAWTWKLHALGIAVRSPAAVGIARP